MVIRGLPSLLSELKPAIDRVRKPKPYVDASRYRGTLEVLARKHVVVDVHPALLEAGTDIGRKAKGLGLDATICRVCMSSTRAGEGAEAIP